MDEKVLREREKESVLYSFVISCTSIMTSALDVITPLSGRCLLFLGP